MPRATAPSPILIAAAFTLAMLLPCSTSGADDPATAALRVRFSDGVSLEAAGRWAEALDRFELVARERPTAEVLFHRAFCLDHLGRLHDAEEAYRIARAHADPDSAVAHELDQHLAQLAQRMPRVVLVLVGKSAGVRVVVDGEVTENGSVQLDPGPHVAIAKRGERVVAAASFSAVERVVKRIPLVVY